MRGIALLAMAAAFGWLMPATAGAQFRMGYVDANVIVQNMPEFKMVETQVGALRQAYEDTLRTMQTALQREIESYKSGVGSMTPEARDEAQAKLNTMQTRIAAYQNDRFGPAGSLAATYEQLLAPVRQRALEATEKVAKAEKLAAVLDLSTFVYVDKKMNVNVTYKVLEYLNTQGN
jgi:outer membrane protein